MNNQNFYLRLIALLMIIMAVFFYNGTVKDKEQEQNIVIMYTKTVHMRAPEPDTAVQLQYR